MQAPGGGRREGGGSREEGGRGGAKGEGEIIMVTCEATARYYLPNPNWG